MKNKIYEKITNEIINNLSRGKVIWQQSWKMIFPMNAISKKSYNGFNCLWLGNQISEKKYKSPYWLTYRQANQLGGHIRKGEKSSMITYWNIYQKKVNKKDCNGNVITKNGKPVKELKDKIVLKKYNVFNIDQVELEDKEKFYIKLDKSFDPILKCEELVKNYKDKPEIAEVISHRAYYSLNHKITIPLKNQFNSIEEYYQVLFHEMIHSTGLKLKRKIKNNFATESYSREELVAEIGSCFLCGIAGIEPNKNNSTGYINGWISFLKDNPEEIIWASSQAQKAVNHILGNTN